MRWSSVSYRSRPEIAHGANPLWEVELHIYPGTDGLHALQTWEYNAGEVAIVIISCRRLSQHLGGGPEPKIRVAPNEHFGDEMTLCQS